MDFGEHLVEVREQLEGPLPIRVPFWRLIGAVAIESFSASMIFLLNRNWRSCAQDRCGLESAHHDLDGVMELFRQLNGYKATPQQIEQAEATFKEQVKRRYDRFTKEIALWITAVHRGLFVGSLLTSLILMSIILCLFTDRTFAVVFIVPGLLVSQLLGAFICLNGWHRP